MRGFLIIDHTPAYAEFSRIVGRWIGQQQILWRETIVEGLENAPSAFFGLFRGENLGKALVRIA